MLTRTDLQVSNTFKLSKFWIEKNQIDTKSIKDDLTVVDRDTKQESRLFFENDTFLFVPRYYGLSKWSKYKELVILLQMGTKIPPENCVFNATLVEKGKKQMTATKSAMAKMFERKSFGCILRMPCGFGKTVCAEYLIAQRQCKTIYIVQAEHLFQQTISSIAKFMPKIRIGQIQGPPKTWEINNCDVVVAMIQTLYAHKEQLKSDLTLQFGFVIVDECHHVGAPMFCAVLQKFAPAWILGLTATPSRSDNKSDWIEWMLGPIVDVFGESERKRPDISIVWSPPLPTSFPNDHLTFLLQQKKTKAKADMAILLNLMQWDVKRRHAQIDHLLKNVLWPLKDENNNFYSPQIVVFAPRVFQLCLVSYALQRRYVTHKLQTTFSTFSSLLLETLSEFLFFHQPMESFVKSKFAEQIKSGSLYYRLYGRNGAFQDQMDNGLSSYLQYVNSITLHSYSPFLFPMRILSTTTTKKKHQLLDRTVVFATVQKLGEGTDVDTLHTVCLISSISSKNKGQFEQVVGRLRKKQDTTKRIVDFRDKIHPLFSWQSTSRQTYYKSRDMFQLFM